jgi:hypothetical protein
LFQLGEELVDYAGGGDRWNRDNVCGHSTTRLQGLGSLLLPVQG